jgi:hypothetical protein
MEEKKKISNDDMKRAAEYLQKNSPFVNNNISHEDFIKEIKSGNLKIAFNIEDIDTYELCSRRRKNILGIIQVMGMFAIPVFIIIFSIINANLWLLIAAPISYIAVIIDHQFGQKLSIFVLLITIGGWFAEGFHFQDYYTFFPLTFIVSTLLTEIVKEYEIMFLTDTLIENSQVFYENKNKITFLRSKSSG